MVFDTNLVIQYVRQRRTLPARAILPVAVVGEIKAFALKADWGSQKLAFIENLLRKCPIMEVTAALTDTYATVDAYSQGKLKFQPLPPGLSARNMGKNDLWIATTALYFDQELHTADNDFDHLSTIGLRLTKVKM